VNPGDILGVVDMSGRTSGPHCHIQVMEKINGDYERTDPLEYIYRNTNQSIILNQSAFPWITIINPGILKCTIRL
jgi:murein DD-endopeptidase MepM/ murein hydrolase activator NlpD